MFYSALEQHRDGSWWFHGNTFESREEAGKFLGDWIPWDKGRNKMVFEHELPLPPETCCTEDGGETFHFGGIEMWNKLDGIVK